eukprot:11534785-Alexandrium_andersonii.AAC.1
MGLKTEEEVYRGGRATSYHDRVHGWPLPFFVVDQFGDITADAKLRRTQGIRYYAGDAKLAEEELRRMCLAT